MHKKRNISIKIESDLLPIRIEFDFSFIVLLAKRNDGMR